MLLNHAGEFTSAADFTNDNDDAADIEETEEWFF